jgi:hypothetical protein
VVASNKAKGQKKEALCSKVLVSEGYWIVFKSCTVKRGPFWVGLDFADCIDVIGVRIVKVPEWMFVSCTYVSHAAERRGTIKKFADEYRMPGMVFQLWVWHPAKWCGRGKAKHFESAHWVKENIEGGTSATNPIQPGTDSGGGK